MNGAMADVWAKRMRKPNMTRRTTIGSSHQSFRSQKNCSSSEAMPKRPTRPRKKYIVPPYRGGHVSRSTRSSRLLKNAMIKHQHVHATSVEGAEGLLRGVHDRFTFQIE